jgi:hypothetical protein
MNGDLETNGAVYIEENVVMSLSNQLKSHRVHVSYERWRKYEFFKTETSLIFCGHLERNRKANGVLENRFC